MADAVRLSFGGMKVLAHLARRFPEGAYGTEMIVALGIRSGTLYPMLARFEETGLCRGVWEEIDPKTEGRPRRRTYVLTDKGLEKSGAAFDELGTIGGIVGKLRVGSDP